MSKITSHESNLSLQSELDAAFKFKIDKCLVIHYDFNFYKDFALFISGKELKSTES